MRVLLADDDPVSLRLLAVHARSLGCSTVQATSGDEALSLLTASLNTFDAVVVDWAMPGIDGLALCRKARELGLRARLVIVTAFDLESRELQTQDADVDAMLSKPFRRDELASALGLESVAGGRR